METTPPPYALPRTTPPKLDLELILTRQKMLLYPQKTTRLADALDKGRHTRIPGPIIYGFFLAIEHEGVVHV